MCDNNLEFFNTKIYEIIHKINIIHFCNYV